MKKILVIDDGNAIFEYCNKFLSSDYELFHARFWEEVKKVLNKIKQDIILLDKVFQVPKEKLTNSKKDETKEGYHIAKKLKELLPAVPVIMISYYDPLDTAEKTIEFGIDDFIEWTALKENRKILKTRLEKLLEKKDKFYRTNLVSEFMKKGFVGSSDDMVSLMERIKNISKSDSTILILGETGTGKDIAAKLIHEFSDRQDKQFIEINLSDLPETLVEDEIFGHEKGAFTGADKIRKSKLENGCDGTVFFNEIGDLKKSVQIKLLQVIEKNEFTRIGGSEKIKVNCRYIFATNKDLKNLVNKKEFREDLFYRIKSHPIILKPLRERKSEITGLVRYFLKAFNDKSKLDKKISEDAVEYLKKQNYPGNIRHLKTIVKNGYDISDEIITLRDIMRVLKERSNMNSNSNKKRDTITIKDTEKEKIIKTLEEFNWNVQPACEKLGISNATMYRRINEYGLKAKIKKYKQKS